MSWQKEVDEIRRREALAKMGGEERIKRQRQRPIDRARADIGPG